MSIVAALQMNSGNEVNKNLDQAYALMKAGVERGAALLALPENFSFMGNEKEKIRIAEDIKTGASVKFLKNFAREHKVWVAGGSIPIRASKDKVYNTFLLINDKGRVAARYDKIHLFDVNLKRGEKYRESSYVKRGTKPVTANTPFGRAGLSICYDLRFPELYRKLAARKAGIFFVPAAFTAQTGKDHWEVLLRARAIENQVYVIAPAQFGSHGKRMTYGNSMIVDPWGKVLARAPDKETVILAELDPSYLEVVRKSIPCLKHIALK